MVVGENLGFGCDWVGLSLKVGGGGKGPVGIGSFVSRAAG